MAPKPSRAPSPWWFAARLCLGLAAAPLFAAAVLIGWAAQVAWAGFGAGVDLAGWMVNGGKR